MLLKLVENVASYICHELANSIGALDSNLEFLENENPYRQEALEIVKQASQHSVSRIKYLRSLYGSKQKTSYIEEIIDLATGILAGTHSLLNFNSPEFKDVHLEVIDEKLLLAFIYIAYSDMPYGGNIEVNITLADENYKIKVSSVSNKIKTKRNLYQILNTLDESQDMSPGNVIAYYVKKLTEHHKKYKILIDSNKIDYIFYAKVL
jgi:hypothetical protein